MNARLLGIVLATVLLVALVAGPASAAPGGPASGPTATTPLEQAREESAVKDRPRTRLELPGGVLRLSASELLASSRQRLELSVTLERDVAEGALELTLPRVWTERAATGDLPYARVPATGAGTPSRAAAERSDRVVRLAFAGGRPGDVASFALTDAGIPAGTYELPYRWRERGGADATGTATVIFYAPTREAAGPAAEWTRLASPGLEKNVTDDPVPESETFLTVVPGDRRRFVVGANGGGGFNAWITDDGQSFTKLPVPALTDAPGKPNPETSALCCDPMSAADATGNIWYGGLSTANGAGQPSRIVVNRIGAGTPSFQPFTVGLPQRTTGTQDKPMMTIDNAPGSPRFGRLYVVWNEPATGGGINIVISQCDTRPGGALNAANCDNADNWTAPDSVTPAPGSYIYADVAASPDGTVNVVWWDFSAANAIRGDTCAAAADCASAAAWGTPQTTATLDPTGGPIPFACPILAQPGGRAAPSPQVEVDRSGGANNGRVYVTWSDLRTDSGTTRCNGAPAPGGAPLATHLTWDSFVASAAGALPGSAAPSATVATRLLTDGEGGGQANSDDWLPWLAVDQTTGQAWADLYSTRDDTTRRTTNFYVRSVTPSGADHTLGALTKVSSAPSDYSTTTCCKFGNDYGDYTGIDATQGVALPVWSDKRDAFDGEAFTFVASEPTLVADTQTISDSAGDNDGTLEPGEPFALTQRLRNTGSAAANGVRATLTGALPELTLSETTSAYPDIGVGAAQPNATPYAGMLAAEAPCGQPITAGLQVTSAQGPFTVPISVPTGALGAARTFTATPIDATIPDNSPTGLSTTLAVSGAGTLGDVDVRVNITHTFDGDLEIRLRAPDGTKIPLSLSRGGLGENFIDTDFDDEAPTGIAEGRAPFTGSFRPEQPLSALDGQDANGTWTLIVIDNARADTGTVRSWRLTTRDATCSPPPATPSLSASASAPGDTTPQITGTAPGGSTVRLYTAGSCTGAPAGTGTAAALASPGIGVTVPAGQTTLIRGTATLGGLTSVCSPPLSYPPPAQPPPAPTATTPTPVTPTPTLPQTAPRRDRSVDVTLTAAASQRALRQRVLRLTVLCAAEPCTVAVAGVVSLPSTKPGGKARGVRTGAARKALRKGQRAALTLKLSSSLRKRLARALRTKRTRNRVRATITATVRDAAGNRRTKRVTIRLRR